MAGVKSLLRLVSANENHSEVLILEVGVDVQHVLFRAARHADCGPILTAVKLFYRPNVIEDYINICKWLKRRICCLPWDLT